MTVDLRRLVTTGDWKKCHSGQTIHTRTEKVGAQRAHWLVCSGCGAKHLVKMETVEDGPEGSH